MAFSSLSSSLITVGKAIKAEIFSTLKSNQDDLQARLLSVEGAANKIRFFNTRIYNASTYATLTGFLFHRIEGDYDLTDCKIILYDKGSISSGTLEIDIQKATSPDFTSSVSVFTTQPSLDLSSASSYSESSNAVFDGTNLDVSEGDYLRLDITSLPTGLGSFGVYLIGEPS